MRTVFFTLFKWNIYEVSICMRLFVGCVCFSSPFIATLLAIATENGLLVFCTDNGHIAELGAIKTFMSHLFNGIVEGHKVNIGRKFMSQWIEDGSFTCYRAFWVHYASKVFWPDNGSERQWLMRKSSNERRTWMAKLDRTAAIGGRQFCIQPALLDRIECVRRTCR